MTYVVHENTSVVCNVFLYLLFSKSRSSVGKQSSNDGRIRRNHPCINAFPSPSSDRVGGMEIRGEREEIGHFGGETADRIGVVCSFLTVNARD